MLVPLRGIFETLDATIVYQGNQISAVRGETVVTLTIGSDTASIDGKTVKLSQRAQIVNGRTLVPLRFVGEALGAAVDYNSVSNEVTVTSTDGSVPDSNATTVQPVPTGGINVMIDGVVQNYDQPPAIVEGRLLVPLRGIFEALHAAIAFQGDRITAVRGETVVQLTIGSDTALVNGKTVQLSQKSIIINGRTLVPLRFVGEALGATVDFNSATSVVRVTSPGETAAVYDVILKFPADRYPGTAAHIQAAISSGESAVCTIDRDGADRNRQESLAGIPTKEGYDRDEWPMAMCEEGGEGADVAYVPFSDNRGSGSWVGNQLEDYPDGTRVLFVISGAVSGNVDPAFPAPATPPTSGTPTAPFASCAEAREAGAAPLHTGTPGYSAKLDRDGDGIACE